MRVHRSMFVGLLALVAAVGMLGANGYYWWLSKSRQTDSRGLSMHSHSSSRQSRPDDLSGEPVGNRTEFWEPPFPDVHPHTEENTPTRQYFPHYGSSGEIAQADGLNEKPGAATDLGANPPPPLLLPDSPTPIAEPPANDWLRELVKQELPEATAEEQRIWSQELRGLDPEMAREILRMRKSVVGLPSIPRITARPSSTPDSPPANFPGPSHDVLVPPPLEKMDRIETEIESSSIAKRLHLSIRALEEARNVALNNLVNVHTPGFKRMRVVLTERPYEPRPPNPLVEPNEEDTTEAVRVGRGVQLAFTRLDVSQGELQETKQPLDVAIEGRGFLQVRVGEEKQYTRFGMCALNEKNELCAIKGGQLCPLEPRITITDPRDRLQIASDGLVCSFEAGAEAPQEWGRISLVRFADPSRLKPVGNQFYSATKASGPPRVERPGQNEVGSLVPGFLEASNATRDEEFEQFQQIQTHLQLLNQLAASAPAEFSPGPVARRWTDRTKHTSVEGIPATPPALKSFMHLTDQSRGLIEEYLQSERMQSIKRTLGLK